MPSEIESTRTPSSTLIAAAFVGLLGVSVTAGCGSDGNGNIDSSGGGSGGSGGAPQSSGGSDNSGGHASSSGGGSGGAEDEIRIEVVSTDEVSFTDFSDDCEKRGGFVTTSAQCAGSNLCRGLSYAVDGTTTTDHSCKGLSGCHGYSCVFLPEDSGLLGEEIYEAGPCAGCHNDAFKGASTYKVFVRPGDTADNALAKFEASSELKLMSVVAFGTQGVNDDGTQFTNMPSYRDKYSRAEIARVVEYLKKLEHPTAQYEIPTR